jgi:hypothetical protein
MIDTPAWGVCLAMAGTHRWSITAWQASDLIAIREPHTGERLVAWAFRCGQSFGDRGVWGLKNGS